MRFLRLALCLLALCPLASHRVGVKSIAPPLAALLGIPPPALAVGHNLLATP